MAVPLDRVTDSLGYLVLAEDGAVVNSGGDLENDEDMAIRMTKIAYTAAKMPLSHDKRDKFKKLSIILDTFMYVITVSNHRIYITKRKYNPQEPVVA